MERSVFLSFWFFSEIKLRPDCLDASDGKQPRGENINGKVEFWRVKCELLQNPDQPNDLLSLSLSLSLYQSLFLALVSLAIATSAFRIGNATIPAAVVATFIAQRQQS